MFVPLIPPLTTKLAVAPGLRAATLAKVRAALGVI